MTSQPAQYILPNISRSKGNQTTKHGQLIECNMRNNFFEKTIHKMWWINLSRALFSKIKIQHISGSIV